MAMDKNNKIEVIIVGAGPAGISCATVLARAGKKVLLVERGLFSGSKNMFGGAIYTLPTKEIFPNFEQEAPLERRNIEHNYKILGINDSTSIAYRKNDNSSYTVIRSKFDRWMCEEAKKAGVYFMEETVVKKLLQKNNTVIGIQTELEEYYSDIVILADGVNSTLAKQIGLRNEFKPKDLALSVKEVIKLDSKIINNRFNIDESEGVISEVFGGEMLGMLGLGFLYTNKDSISIGVGITLEDLIKKKQKPYEILEKIKNHPSIAPLIEGGKIIEYSAHLIPEGGYKKMPKLYDNGVMVIGDAAMLVNNLHWEGTNLAMISGKIAGETAIHALNKQDFSKKSLSKYEKTLKSSFIGKDLKTYKDLMDAMHNRKNAFLKYYLVKINSFFDIFTSVNGIPKKDLYRSFIKDFLCNRKFMELFKDIFTIAKLVWSILL